MGQPRGLLILSSAPKKGFISRVECVHLRTLTRAKATKVRKVLEVCVEEISARAAECWPPAA